MVNDVYKLANYANVATAIKDYKAAEEKLNMVVVSCLAGDFISPSLSTSLDGGRAMLEVVNQVGFDMVSIGNHEFDVGMQGLASNIGILKSPTQVLNSNIHDACLDVLPKVASVAVGERVAVFGGYCTHDPSIYSPSTQPSFTPINESILNTWQIACAGGRKPDLFVPLTHQLTHEDKNTCIYVKKKCPELAQVMPVVVAGHDHSVFIDEAGSSMVVKVGVDAINIGVIDVWWDDSGSIKRRVCLLPCEEFAPDPAVMTMVSKQEQFLQDTMGVAIAYLPTAMSSTRVRFEPSGMATWLLDKVKEAYTATHNADLALINAGAVRGGQEYAAHSGFTMGDLYQEFAFDTLTCLVELPGHILRDSIVSSRNGAKPDPSFLHFDGAVDIAQDTHQIRAVNGKPFCADAIYRCVTYRSLLTGMNEIQPMTRWCADNVKVPDEEICRPAKEVVMSVCMRQAWRQLVGFQAWDVNHDGVVDADEVRAGVRKLFGKWDKNDDGYLDGNEMKAFLQNKETSASLAVHLIRALDNDHDGRVSFDELMQIVPFH